MRKMKDSGVEWIGEIPSKWLITKVKFILEQSASGIKIGPFGSALTNSTIGNGAYNVYGQYSLINNDFHHTKHTVNQDTFDRLQAYEVTPGDICISMMGTIGKCNIVPKGIKRGIMDSHLIKARLGDTIKPRYFQYVFDKDLGGVCYSQMQLEKKGTIMDGVNTSIIKNLVLPLPSIEEQQRIVDYLDPKCAKIDAIIERQQAVIEKLKAYKQSVITEAVTNGLNPDVVMKDSGVNWLGKIPNTWKTYRGKVLFFETDIRSVDGSEELLTVSQYTGITPRSQKNVNMFEAVTLEGYKICEVDDIVANTMWLWAGAIGVSSYQGVISPSYNTYRQRKKFYNSKYLDYLLRTPRLVQEYAANSTGIRSSRLRLYPKNFLNIVFPVPTLEEQNAIVDSIDSKMRIVDQYIEIKGKQIEKLQQYKKSLIYEVVTGKKQFGK